MSDEKNICAAEECEYVECEECCCDHPEMMPELNRYLVALEEIVLECALKLGIALSPKPRIATTSGGGTGDGDKSAGWGNGNWP